MTKIALIACAVFAVGAYEPTDADRARWTMSDMMSWRTAIQAYAIDHSVYPDVKTLEELRGAVQPLYIVHAPVVDAWGNPYRYERLTEKNFRLVSAGADGKFDEATWSVPGKRLPFDADAVVTDEGRWMFRSWDLTDAESARRTLGEMREIRTAIEGYVRVHNAYPAAKTMDELRQVVQPDYIKVLPMRDEWGNPFLYELDDKVGYRVVSAGADGKFDRATWSTGGTTNSYADDAVANGDRPGWFRCWEPK